MSGRGSGRAAGRDPDPRSGRPGRTPSGPRLRRGLLALLCGSLLAAGAIELGFRFLLFRDAATDLGIARRLRNPSNFADPTVDDDYWKLLTILNPTEQLPVPGFDPRVGWTGSSVEPGTYRHRDEGGVGERRPILLFGDSYAQGVTAPEHRFEALLERSPLGADFALLNYGVGGYGVGQMYLLLERVLDRHAERDPIVCIAILVDNDLERTGLSFRGWPKPRLELAGLGGPGLAEPAPVLPGVSAHLERHPVSIRSYAWRYLARRTSLLPRGLRRRITDRREELDSLRELNRRVLAAMKDELESRGLEYFFVVFHGLEALKIRGERYGWEEGFLGSTLHELGLPYVSSKAVLGRYAREHGLKRNTLFGKSGEEKGHYTAEGNAAVFDVFWHGLQRRFEPRIGSSRTPRLAAPDGVTPAARAPSAEPPRGRPGNRTPGWVLIEAGVEPTELRYDLVRRYRRVGFRARSEGPGTLALRVDGELLHEIELAEGEDVALEGDVRGRAELTLTVRAADGGRGVRVRLVEPILE